MIQPKSGAWNFLNRPAPHVSLALVAFDETGKFPVVFRSDKVRSVKNSWSLPTGLHEAGLTFGEQGAIELDEELGLTADPQTWRFLTVYENIVPQDDWHWVIVMGSMRVNDMSVLVNREPIKHSEVQLMDPFSTHYADDLARKVMDAPMKDALLRVRHLVCFQANAKNRGLA